MNIQKPKVDLHAEKTFLIPSSTCNIVENKLVTNASKILLQEEILFSKTFFFFLIILQNFLKF